MVGEIVSRARTVPLEEIAILYRTNAQSRVFEDRLMHRGIEYRVVGGLKFYDRKEVKDFIAYLKLIANPDDDVAFARVVNTPNAESVINPSQGSCNLRAREARVSSARSNRSKRKGSQAAWRKNSGRSRNDRASACVRRITVWSSSSWRSTRCPATAPCS